MNLTGLSIKNNRVTYGMLVVLMCLGMISYNDLPRENMPTFIMRVASIVTNYNGVGPELIEELVTVPIEEVAQELPEIKTITSTSRTGLSMVSVSLYDDVPEEKIQLVWDKLRRKISKIKNPSRRSHSTQFKRRGSWQGLRHFRGFDLRWLFQ